ILQSRRLRRAKLHPATSNAFDEWLVQLDQLRIAACEILESSSGKEQRKLAAVPKIAVRSSGACPEPSAEKTSAADNAYESLGSASTQQRVALAGSSLAGLDPLSDALSSQELATAS